MKHFFQRRTILGIMLTSLLAACSRDKSDKTSEQKAPVSSSKPQNEVYQHGVASGDPDASSVVIWTRINANAATEVSWELSISEDFSSSLRTGKLTTDENVDFTVKAIPDRLEAGKTYFYRFITDGTVSPIGRTKTLPNGDLKHFGIALASCSNYAFGYFNAYDAIAKDQDIDLVLHTGDYIYEYGADGWGSDTAKQLGRVHQPAHEIVTLADYRTRHAQYKTDLGAQAMHAKHPMVCCWDDHESTNNPWLGGAQNHQPETEGNWPQRRAASVQAYYEWMPIRDPQDPSARLAYSRAYTIGNLASLVTLESRHTARAEQIDYLKYAESIQSKKDADAFKRDVIGAANREMLSKDTEQLVADTFKASKEQDQPWRLLGNASPIARMLVPDVKSLGTLNGESTEQLESDAAKALIWKGQYQLPFYTDTWDGYPWARERFYQTCQSAGAQDLIFLTGDSHSFWMNQLANKSGEPMGLELGTAGISSPGDFVESGWNPQVAEKLDRVFESELDEVVWTDNFNQGYVRIELTPKLAKASFIAVDTVLEPVYKVKMIKQTFIQKSGKYLKYST